MPNSIAILKLLPFAPDPEEHQRRGDALLAEGRPRDAILAYREAINLDPDHVPAWYGAGCAFNALQEYPRAFPCWEQVLSRQPEHYAAHHNYGKSLFQVGQIEEAFRHFEASLALSENTLPRTAIATSIPALPSASHTDIRAARVEWARRYLPAPRPPARAPRTSGPLRIGYISSFFASANWMKPVWGLIHQHDRRHFQVHLVSDAPRSACAQYEPHPDDHFLDISGLSNDEAADRIEQLELDLLIDLNSYSDTGRLPLLARKPAPILVAWFNLYATSGIPAYDYLIGDDAVIKPEEESDYTEKIVRVPGSYLTYQVQYPVPPVAPAPFLRHGYLTFGSLASLHKLNPTVIAAWAEILHRAPTAHLLLKNDLLDRTSVQAYIHQSFVAHGIAPERIHYSGAASHFDFLAAYADIDVALDPFPYNGGTTTSEALWQGVPVVCFDGDRWAARQGVSLLRAAGLTAFTAPDLPTYIETAIALSDSPAPLAALRVGMRSHLLASSVCDTATFARHMETLYRSFTPRAATSA